MAILGRGGRLRLKREAPEPTVLRPGNINTLTDSIYMRNPAFWSGDTVTLTCANGLPIDADTDGPDCPDGYAVYYGSDWYQGSNRSHITTNNDPFYKATNSAQFYMREQECGLLIEKTCFIYRDQLDRISFYETRAEALNGEPSTRIPLYKVDFNGLIVAATSSSEYQNAMTECSQQIGDYQFSDVQDEVSLESICDIDFQPSEPPSWITEYDEAYVSSGPYSNSAEWIIQANLKEWTLNLSSPEVDTTSVGDRFGDSVKALVTGGGSMDFIIERQNIGDSYQDSTGLLHLLLLIEKGCKADAEFWITQNRAASECQGRLPGDLFYETQLMVTSVAVNTRPDEIVAGSLNFVTVGQIALRMGTN